MNRAPFCGRADELKVLKDAWLKVSRELKDGEVYTPQVICLVAEAGLGKTRLVQEFYNHLAQQARSEEGKGYWPSTLSQEGLNLEVNPDIRQVTSEEVMPFLWWGIRLLDPTGQNQITGRSVASHLEFLEPHLQPLYQARRRKQHWIDSRNITGSTALGFIPVLGDFIGVGQAILELNKVRQNARDEQTLSPHEAQEKQSKSLNERILSDLRTLFKQDKKAASIPMVWIIDDAQFSTTDPSLVELFENLIHQAQINHWPLLVIVTHWEKEWHEQQSKPEQVSIASSIKSKYQNLNPNWQAHKLNALLDEQLEPLLTETLTGLTKAQRSKLLERVDGNPRFLEQIILLAQDEPELFEDYDSTNALTEEGLETLLASAVDIHSTVKKRLANAPESVRQAISLSSLQGMRLIRLVTNKLIDSLSSQQLGKLHPKSDTDFEQAQTPYSFLNNLSTELSEFSQRVFYEVAHQGIKRVVPEVKAQAALVEVLRELSSTSTESLSNEEQELLLELTAEVLSQSEEADDRQAALSAYAQLVEQALNKFDYKAALAIAQKVLAGQKQNKWKLNSLRFNQVWDMQDAFSNMGELNEAFELALSMQEIAEATGNKRDLSVAHNFLGNIQGSRGQLDDALKNYQQGLAISEALLADLGTPQAKRDVSVSLDRIGDIQRNRGQLDDALKNYQQCLAILEALLADLGTPQAKRDVSISLNKIADIQRSRGQLDDALKNYQQGLAVREELLADLATPEAKRDVNNSIYRIADIQLSRGQLDAALENFEKYRAIAEALLADLGTPEAKRDVSVSLNKIADIQLSRGQLDDALKNYQQCLAIDEELLADLATPEAKRDVAVSFSRLAVLAQAQEDSGLFKSYLEKGLEAAKAYQQVMPYEDAAGVVAWFENQLNAL